ncbi:MAG: recombination protein RecR [Bacteroidia bacterium]|nr:recombination protein RecR [Bacteroidia bacterium]
MEYPSKVIESAVSELSKLPGIGKKTALRLALHLLRQPESDAELLGGAIISLRRDIRYCDSCGNISDDSMCQICSNPRRDPSQICVVEDCKDVIALENTNQFQGRYHVLGGLINPLMGIRPSSLNIDPLLQKTKEGEVKEIIFAFAANLEGDTTAFYISRKLQDYNLRISSIARGIPVGSDLEFTDEITLARSIMNRTLFSPTPENSH